MTGHETGLIVTIAASFGLALIFGFIAAKCRMPPLVGYLLAGVVIGPATPGLVADVGAASQLAEIGVMLLMFGVGLHLSLDDLLAVKRIAIPGAIVQMAFATAVGTWLAVWWGWSTTSAVIFGVSLSCASTVVLLKALESRGLLETIDGRIAVGWLVVEDLVTVFALVMLPPLAGRPGPLDEALGVEMPTWAQVLLTLGQVAVFFAIMLFAGRRFLPWVLWQIARVGSRELFTVAVIALAIGIAFGAAELFEVSFALGAFVAGMVLRESEFSHRAGQDTLPLRDAFAVLFFVAVGMLLDPMILVEEPLKVLAVVAIIMVGKSLIATLLVLRLRYPINTALIMGASLSQIGEFSFILAGLALTLGLIPSEGLSLIVAGAFISIALNPLMFGGMGILRRILLKRTQWAQRLDFQNDVLAALPTGHGVEPPSGHVILIGYGRVGRRIYADLVSHDVRCVVIELTREPVEKLRERGVPALAGDGARPELLIEAGIERADAVVIASPTAESVTAAAETVRRLRPDIDLIVRTHSAGDWERFEEDVVSRAYFGEEELAASMVQPILDLRSRGRATTVATSD